MKLKVAAFDRACVSIWAVRFKWMRREADGTGHYHPIDGTLLHRSAVQCNFIPHGSAVLPCGIREYRSGASRNAALQPMVHWWSRHCCHVKCGNPAGGGMEHKHCAGCGEGPSNVSGVSTRSRRRAAEPSRCGHGSGVSCVLAPCLTSWEFLTL